MFQRERELNLLFFKTRMVHHKSKLQTLSSSIFFFFFFLCVIGDDGAYMLKLLKAITPTPHGWSNNTHMCDWIGVDCGDYAADSDSDSLRVISIYLDSMSLSGTLPSGLNSLSYLYSLSLHKNSFTGPLPSLTNLTSLTYVDLSHNNFTSIPHGCFQGLTNLDTLILSYNVNLEPWTIPTDLTHSSKLKVLDLAATNIKGFLPDIFDSFPILETLVVSYNNITGVLPKSFARSQISTLWLNDQHPGLSGKIDVLSSMIYLSQVWLQWNAFTGSIPDLSNCIKLVDLQLKNNELTGVVPPSLMNLPSLLNCSLEFNWLQGPVPVFVGMGVNVSFHANDFCRYDPGPCDYRVTTLLEVAAAFEYPIQLAKTWVGNNPCQDWRYILCVEGKIRAVHLAKLNLTGTISPAFANLTDLWHLYLSGNSLTGPIPQSLTTLTQLEVLDVSNNNLSGEIPQFSPKVKFIATGNVLLGPFKGAKGSTTIPTLDSAHGPTTSRSTVWIAGASTGGVVVIIIFIVVIYNRKRCLILVHKMMLRKTGMFLDQSVEDFIKRYGSLTPKRYSYSELKRITNSFCDKLGQGGYGVVYKASLTDGRQVAVKVISESKGSGEEFMNEVASISRTSHVNIISLLGFCYEMNKRALIYEFMPHGSLEKFIYKKGSLNAICSLDWNTLFHITIGIAQGLEYLHQGCNTRILHLDIKPQNVLLDENFCPKIADFGLAKICIKKESIVSILGPRGTPGYIAPEVFSRAYGGVSHKSDVYSYGMLILEVVGGRKNYDNGGSHTSEMYFPDWIYKDIEQGNIPRRCLANTEEENDMVMKITLVSLWCIQPNPSDRPSMTKVLEMLEGPLQSVPYPPKPIFYSPERFPLQFSDISYSDINETNSVTTQEIGYIK